MILNFKRNRSAGTADRKRSKCSGLARLPLLLAILLLCAVRSQAQNKIGDITVSSEIFKDYIYNCYSRPDTVKAVSEYDFYSCSNCLLTEEQVNRAKDLSKKFDDNLEQNNIGHVQVDGVWYYLMPRKPSEQDFVKWYSVSK